MNALTFSADLLRLPQNQEHGVIVCLPYEAARKMKPGADNKTQERIVRDFVRLGLKVISRYSGRVSVRNATEAVGTIGVAGKAVILRSLIDDLEKTVKSELGPLAEIDYEDVNDFGDYGDSATSPTAPKLTRRISHCRIVR